MSAFKSIQQVRSEIRQQVLSHLQQSQIPFQLDRQSVCVPAGRLDFTHAELQLHPHGKASRYLPYHKVRLSQLAPLFRSNTTKHPSVGLTAVTQ